MFRSTIVLSSVMPLARRLRWSYAAFLLVGMVGCQRGPQLGRVTGTVTANGEPVPFAYIVFNPVKPPRNYGSAYANEKGQYELKFSNSRSGAPVGQHQVSITAAKGEDLPDNAKGAARLRIPSKYNTETELRADVKPGTNVIDFALVIDATQP